MPLRGLHAMYTFLKKRLFFNISREPQRIQQTMKLRSSARGFLAFLLSLPGWLLYQYLLELFQWITCHDTKQLEWERVKPQHKVISNLNAIIGEKFSPLSTYNFIKTSRMSRFCQAKQNYIYNCYILSVKSMNICEYFSLPRTMITCFCGAQQKFIFALLPQKNPFTRFIL